MATTPELISFVQTQLAAGTTRDTLRRILGAQGWALADIEAAMASVSLASDAVAPLSAEAPHAQSAPTSHTAVKIVVAVVVVVAVLGLLALTAYAYVEKLGPFNRPPYTEASMLNGMLQASASVTSLTFTASSSLSVVPRESGEEPFVATTSASAAAAYARDYSRVQNISNLLQYLQNYVSRYTAPLPTLSGSAAAKARGVTPRMAQDPSTAQPYAFISTENGRNFSLTAVFETPEAVAAIKASPFFSASTTAVHDLTVTFTKGSSAWIFLQQAPPQPFLVQLQDVVGKLPEDTNVSVALSGASDRSLAVPAAKMLLQIAGRVSGSSAALSLDVVAKDNRYYVRVNELPLELQAFMPIPTNLWIDVTDSISTSTAAAALSNTGVVSPQTLDSGLSYTKESPAYRTYLADVLQALRSSNLIAFRRAPYREQVDGESLYRYDLTIRKDAVVPFAQTVLALAKKDLSLSAADLERGNHMIAYLQSAEFATTFAYVLDHWDLSVWFDARGVPRAVDTKYTIVPSSLSPALADKEVVFESRLTNADINVHPVIEAPATSTSLQAVMAQLEGGSTPSREATGSASADAYLSTIQTSAEIYYAENPNTYGVSGVGCLRAGNFFGGDKTVQSAVAGLTKLSTVRDVSCVVGKNGTSYAAEVGFIDGSYTCVDSRGAHKTETAPLGARTVCP